MKTISIATARAKLCALIDRVAESHEPIQITGRQSDAVLVSSDDWRSIQETLHLMSIPKMRESIQIGMKTPLSKCKKALKW